MGKSNLEMSRGLMRRMNKKGQVVAVMSNTAISIFILIFIVFAILFGVAVLNPASFFTSGSKSAVAIQNLTDNLTEGASQLGAQIPNTFKILAVVMVLGGIFLLIAYVRRMQSVEGQGAGGSL